MNKNCSARGFFYLFDILFPLFSSLDDEKKGALGNIPPPPNQNNSFSVFIVIRRERGSWAINDVST